MRIKTNNKNNSQKKALISNESPTEKETNSKITLINLEPLIIDK